MELNEMHFMLANIVRKYNCRHFNEVSSFSLFKKCWFEGKRKKFKIENMKSKVDFCVVELFILCF